MPFLSLPDVEMYYELHGRKPSEAPAVVFAHGAGGNHLSWWQQVPHFRARFACVTFDHRGFGLSRPHEGGPVAAAFADDLHALLDDAGIERATIVAQSMGGWTALRFAVQHPERVERIVMCDTHGGLRSPEIAEAMRGVERTPPPEGVHPAAGARMVREQPELHFLYTQIDSINPERGPQDVAQLIRDAGTVSVDEAQRLTMPVLFIVGGEDILIPPAVIAAASRCIARAQLEIVERAGHSVYFERAATFNAIVDRFLT